MALEKFTVYGEELIELTTRLAYEGRHIFSIAVGKTNAEWIVLVEPKAPAKQIELAFVNNCS